MSKDVGLPLKDIITACIAAFNIAATILLSLINIFFLNKNTRRAIKRDVFDKYYLPLADKLDEINEEFKIVHEQNQDFDIFNPTMPDANCRKRENIITVSYKNFMEFESGLEKGYFYKKIDTDILNVKKHMRFMIMIFGREQMKDREEQKREYPLPDYNKIVKTIYAKR
jgi:hypothetical protein